MFFPSLCYSFHHGKATILLSQQKDWLLQHGQSAKCQSQITCLRAICMQNINKQSSTAPQTVNIGGNNIYILFNNPKKGLLPNPNIFPSLAPFFRPKWGRKECFVVWKITLSFTSCFNSDPSQKPLSLWQRNWVFFLGWRLSEVWRGRGKLEIRGGEGEWSQWKGAWNVTVCFCVCACVSALLGVYVRECKWVCARAHVCVRPWVAFGEHRCSLWLLSHMALAPDQSARPLDCSSHWKKFNLATLKLP